MDELELLKRDWKKQEASLPKYDQKELYIMLQKKSTSIVRWIFIISIIEFLFWIGLDILGSMNGYDDYIEEANLGLFYRTMLIVNYTIIAGFIVLFFYNFKQINVTDNARKLMKNILRTRKTVKYYIWFNIILFSISFIYSMYKTGVSNFDFSQQELSIFILISFGIMLVFILFIWLFYRLIYGILTRKLYKNYEELKRIDL